MRGYQVGNKRPILNACRQDEEEQGKAASGLADELLWLETQCDAVGPCFLGPKVQFPITASFRVFLGVS
jgi:hypothetical protein